MDRLKEVLADHITARLGTLPPNLDLVMAQFEPFRFKRNAYLLEAGQSCDRVFFLVKGCVQVFVTDENGNEQTRDVVVEDAWVTDLMAFGSGEPAHESIRALEPTSALSISRQRFGLMMEQVPAFDVVYKQILEKSYANSVYRIHSFMALTALDRIKWLMEHRPGLANRVSGRVLASYLGIHKDVFSRLRSQL